jgi:hypothetical protein
MALDVFSKITQAANEVHASPFTIRIQWSEALKDFPIQTSLAAGNCERKAVNSNHSSCVVSTAQANAEVYRALIICRGGRKFISTAFGPTPEGLESEGKRGLARTAIFEWRTGGFFSRFQDLWSRVKVKIPKKYYCLVPEGEILGANKTERAGAKEYTGRQELS